MSGIAITIRLGDHEVPGVLNGTATASSLLELLPLELPLKDFRGQEKLGRLPRPLTTRDAPAAAGAEPADIGYYSPLQHLVLYYTAVGAFPGIVPIGSFAADAVDLVRDLADGTVAVIARD